MCRRCKSRVAFGRPIAEQAVTRERIAEARIMIDQARLLTLNAAWMMDTVGNKAARGRDRHDQGAGAETWPARSSTGRSRRTAAAASATTFGLGHAYAQARTLRLADGPDEVHRNQIARLELEKYPE